MLKQIKWKNYLIAALVFTVVSVFFKWPIALGYSLGTVIYFVNLYLAEKKFPKLEGKMETVSKALLVMLLQGGLTALMAILTYMIGKLPCFFAGFGAMIVPNIYFFIVGSK